MSMKRILLGTTALLGSGLLAAGSASAAEVKAGGAFDLTISGFARFLANAGDYQARTGLAKGSNGLDFSNDTEVNILGKATDESTGIEYGFRIEFEADTNETANTDETWLFISGQFGEFRFGDEDGASDNMALGAQTIAVGTGGIDGTLVDQGAVVKLSDSSDSTKLIYYSPKFAGFQLGVDYTPHSSNNNGRQGAGSGVANLMTGEVKDWFSAGLAWTGDLGPAGVKASVTGMYGTDESGDRDGDTRGVSAGAVVDIYGFSVAGAWGTEEVLGFERSFYNLGAAAALGPVKVSINWGDAYDTDGAEPWDMVLGAEVGLMPGVAFSVEWSHFDTDRGGAGDDSGDLGVARLAFSF
ncbi:porin [Geminicoccaceae bacterium 1502E]|nr:porin [Geminicoccaceae bacterium 1502E]